MYNIMLCAHVHAHVLFLVQMQYTLSTVQVRVCLNNFLLQHITQSSSGVQVNER